MIIAWMAYGLLAAGLIGIAAMAIERGMQMARRSIRWVWCGALAATVGLTVLAPMRAARDHAPARVTRVETIAPRAAEQAAPVEAPAIAPAAAPREIRQQTTITGILPLLWLMEPHSAPAELLAGLGWLVSTAGLSILLLSVARRYATARDRWPVADIDGVTVRVTPQTGPAVLGFIRPWIAVPAWLLDRTPEEQQMVVDHEAEHLLAGDHRLLAAGWAAIALMPWNVVLWWMVVRLRMAIEIDCDRRMLRRGVSPHSYGLLLIDVASEYRGLALGTTAFSSRPSQLERRLRAMKGTGVRFGRLRAAGFLMLAMVAVLLAAGAPLPHLDAVSVSRVFAPQISAGASPQYETACGDVCGWSGFAIHVINDSVPGFTLNGPVRKKSGQVRETISWPAGDGRQSLTPWYSVRLHWNGGMAWLSCTGLGDDKLVCANPICYHQSGNDWDCQDPSSLVSFHERSTTFGPALTHQRSAGVPLVPASRLGHGTVSIDQEPSRQSRLLVTSLLHGTYSFSNGRVVTGDSAAALSGTVAARSGVVLITLSPVEIAARAAKH